MASTQLLCYLTNPHDCSYLPNQQARSQVIDDQASLSPSAYDSLIQQGFRRSGLYIYRPLCDQCQACISLRIPVQSFAPNRTQRRVWRSHQNLVVTESPLTWSDEHFDLYQRYLDYRHHESDDLAKQDGAEQLGDIESPEEAYRNFLLTSSVETRLVEFRLTTGELMMVSVIDCVHDGLSAVYAFFEPAIRQMSFGTYNVLWQIETAKRLGLPYVYLGYWISGCQKMVYKANFKPAEILQNGAWQLLI